MRRHTREMHIDDYEAWSAAQKRHDAVVEAADEEGGPRLSLVPQPDRGEVWPTDLLSPTHHTVSAIIGTIGDYGTAAIRPPD